MQLLYEALNHFYIAYICNRNVEVSKHSPSIVRKIEAYMWQAVAGILAASVSLAAFQMVYENYSKSLRDPKTSDKVAQIGAGQEKDKSGELNVQYTPILSLVLYSVSVVYDAGAHTKKWKAPLWKIGSKLRK